VNFKILAPYYISENNSNNNMNSVVPVLSKKSLSFYLILEVSVMINKSGLDAVPLCTNNNERINEMFSFFTLSLSGSPCRYCAWSFSRFSKHQNANSHRFITLPSFARIKCSRTPSQLNKKKGTGE
jgi:hypothetical protein